MKDSKMKMVSVFLIACMILINIPTVQADKLDISSSDIYVNEEENYMLERVVDKTKVTVFVKSLSGDTQHVVVNDNGSLYLDGELLQEETYNDMILLNSKQLLNIGQPSTYASDNWGRWSTTWLGPYKTGGLSVAVIAGIISAVAPWVSLRAAAAAWAVVAAKADTIKIKTRIRWKSTPGYLHYQRQTSIHDGGSGKKIAGPYKDGGRNRH